MSLESILRGLAGEIGKNRSATGAEAAPAKLRHRTGVINAYTVGDLTATVQVGADLVDAPFVASYTPAAGDAVSVLINNGSPLILGAVNKAPAVGGGVVAAIGRYSCSTTLAPGSILVMDTLTSSYGPIGDHISINGDGTLGMLTVGMYQISGGGSVAAAAGTLCGLSVNPFIAQPKPSIANRSDSDAGGQANLQCSAPPFFNDTVGNEIQASVSPDGSVTNPFIALYVVKFVD